MRHLLLALFLSAAPVAAQQSIAIKAGKVVTAPGQSIENGIVVVRNGRIEAIGADIEVPFDIILREYPEAVLFSGYLEAHTSSGMDRSNENVAVSPFLDVKDSIDPVSFYFEDQLREGVVGLGVIPGNSTVVGGLGRVVAPTGLTVERMTLSSAMGMKVAIGPKRGWTRVGQMAELREAVAGLKDTLRRLGQKLLDEQAAEADAARDKDDHEEEEREGGFIRFGEDFPGKELIGESDVNRTQTELVRLLNGETRMWLWCPEAVDVLHGIEFAEAEGLADQTVFVISSAAWKAAEQLAATGRPVVLQGDLWHTETDPVTLEETRTFVPSVLSENHIQFALTSLEGSMGPDRLAYQAAVCVREGISRTEALSAVTTRPASFWGISDRVGQLAAGADGTFTLLSGEPLDPASNVLEVYIFGERVYERATDERLQRLLEGRAK